MVHIFGQEVYNKQIIPEYYPLFKTSLKMFEDNIFLDKVLGLLGISVIKKIL